MADISLLKKGCGYPFDKGTGGLYGAERFDLDSFISRYGIKVRERTKYAGGGSMCWALSLDPTHTGRTLLYSGSTTER